MAFFEKFKNSKEETVEEESKAPAKPRKIEVQVDVKDREPRKKKTEEGESWFEPEGELSVDVYETDKDIVIQSAVAGVNPENLDVSIEDDLVTISGERNNSVQEEGKNYFYQECFWGNFSRQIILPQEVDPEKAEATIKEGIFTLRIPKLNKEKVKKVKVKG